MKDTHLKKTPEGLIYMPKLLITKSINLAKDIKKLKFYDYEKIILMFESEKEYETNKEAVKKLKRELKRENIQLYVSIKNTKKKDVAVFDFKDKENIMDAIKKAHLIYNLEANNKKDKLNVAYSNFNQVYAKEFSLRNIILGISIRSISEPRLIPKIKQNLKLARKYKIPIILSSFDEETIFGWYEAMQMLRVIIHQE